MNVPNVEGEKPTKYKYVIAEFLNCVNETGCQDVDIVPSSWVYYDSKKKTCMVPYPNPPYNNDVVQMLHKLVKNTSDPLQIWPTWPILLKGGANTYKKAEKRCKLLRQDAYAFSTDVDDQEEKANQLLKKYQQDTLENILSVTEVQRGISNCSSKESSEDDISPFSLRTVRNVETKSSKSKQVESTTKNTLARDESVATVQINKHNLTSEALNNNTYSTSNRNRSPVPAIIETTNFEIMPDSELLEYADQVCSNIEATVDKKCFQKTLGKTTSLNFTPEQSTILNAIASVKIMLREVKIDVSEIKLKLLGSNIETFEAELANHNLRLPLDCVGDYKKFEELLQNHNFYENFVSVIQLCLDKAGNNVRKSITNILQKIFTKRLILQFTALKKVSKDDISKNVFKESACYKPIKDTLLNFHKDGSGNMITESTFNTALSSSFSNSKDWGGRTKK